MDISLSFAGTFFRVDGAGAAPFGTVQEEFIPHISQINHTQITPLINLPISLPKLPQKSILFNFKSAEISDPLLSSQVSAYESVTANALTFKWATGEVRPRNMAVKVWRRLI